MKEPDHSSQDGRVRDISAVLAQNARPTVHALQSRARRLDVSSARRIALYLAQEMTTLPQARIGTLCGGLQDGAALDVTACFRRQMENDVWLIADNNGARAALTRRAPWMTAPPNRPNGEP